MKFEYMQYPTKIKEVATEIIRACNAYKARQINNDDLRDIILYYATNYPEKLFNGADLNPTVKKIIGIQRIEIVNKLLEGYQSSLFQRGGNYAR